MSKAERTAGARKAGLAFGKARAKKAKVQRMAALKTEIVVLRKAA